MGPGNERARLHATRLGGAHHPAGGQELFSELKPLPAKPAFTAETRPPASRPYDTVTLSPAGLVDRPADSRLSFERDGSSFSVQLAPPDRRALFAALSGAVLNEERAQFVRDFLTERLAQARHETRTTDSDLFPADPAGEDAAALERVIAMLEER